MSFLDLKSQVLQNLPAPLKAHWGVAQSPAMPGGGNADPFTSGVSLAVNPSAAPVPTVENNSGADPFAPQPHPSLVDRLTRHLPRQFQPRRLIMPSAAVNPNLPAGQANLSAAPGSTLKPLSVDELFKRMPQAKGGEPKKPKFSLSPAEIRCNPLRLEQEQLQKEVYALPWNDENVINPFHTGPCNIPE